MPVEVSITLDGVHLAALGVLLFAFMILYWIARDDARLQKNRADLIQAKLDQAERSLEMALRMVNLSKKG